MDYFLLAGTNLFRGIEAASIEQILPCLGAREKAYGKNETIFHTGEVIHEVGLVLEGSANVVVNFYRGNSHIFAHVERGEIFAETYAAIPEQELLCDVVAAEDCRILFLNVDRILTSCSNSCGFHKQLIQNLVRISATKNLHMSTRMMHIAPKSIRERLLSYLWEQVIRQGSRDITIPFSRQQMADYLGVDRSALSGELSKMCRDGLIVYRKNEFSILVDLDR